MSTPAPVPHTTDPPDAERAPAPMRPRRRFLLGRLAVAVRRQDWFTVLVEITIVVLGVVIGFQVTAWGQARADRAKERAYLVQLDGDLRETLRRVAEAEATSAPRVRAAGRLVRAYRMPEPPPEDSLLQWLYTAFNLSTVEPVVATAEALVATGDLALVRDDSLRRAIPAYLSQTRVALASQDQSSDGAKGSFEEATRVFDFWELAGEVLPQAVVDSLARTDDAFGLPAGPRTQPFPLRATDLLGDRAAYRAVYLTGVWQMNLQLDRDDMRDEAERLLALVESARGVRPSGVALPDTTARRP